MLGPDVIANLKRLVERLPEGWTDDNAHDPGNAVLELMAWLAGALARRDGSPNECTAGHAAHVAAAALALIADRDASKRSVLKARFLKNPASDGSAREIKEGCQDGPARETAAGGVVCGFSVKLSSPKSSELHVSAGLALDMSGRPIVLQQTVRLPLVELNRFAVEFLVFTVCLRLGARHSRLADTANGCFLYTENRPERSLFSQVFS